MVTSRMGIKCKPLSVCERLNMMNKVHGIASVPGTVFHEQLVISVRKVTDKTP
jgi:hypothetical protein